MKLLTPAMRARLWSGACLLAAVVVTVGSTGRSLEAQDSAPPPAGRPEPTSQDTQPTFRVEAGYVRVDAYATKDGQAVRDLTADEFEVFEDGVPQKIETFEHVEVRGAGPQLTRREPNSVREGLEEATNPRARIFVIFLDRYYVEVAGSHRMQRALTNMLEDIIAPDDLFAVMTPDMSAKDISLARRTTTIEEELSKYWYWGEMDQIGVFDEREAQLELCYGMRSQSEVTHELIDRLREKRSLDALADLSRYLRGVRDERKAVIPVTAGWLLYRENPALANSQQPADPGRIGVDPTGRITTDKRGADNVNYSRHQCDVLRQHLAFLDNWQTYHDLLDLANRSNVSFYPVDPRGLTAIDTPAGFRDQLPPHLEIRRVRARVDNLRTLADETDGLAVVETNDVSRGMTRIVDDLTSYYLLGYYTSNPRLDGKYRRIEVRSSRPGVEIRHRRGYRAATAEEIESSRETSADSIAEAPPSAVQAAFNSLGGARSGVPLRTTVGYMARDEGGAARLHLWTLAELDTSVARTDEWVAGGEAEVRVAAADGTPLAMKTVAIPPRARAVTAEIPDVPVPDGELLVRIRLKPAQGGLPLTDTLRLDVPASSTAPAAPLLMRRGPTTGIEYLPTADRRFRRTERLRVELPTNGPVSEVTAEVLDRNGNVLQVPPKTATRADGPVTWATAEVALAPLAPGDYAMRLAVETGGRKQEVITGFRLVP